MQVYMLILIMEMRIGILNYSDLTVKNTNIFSDADIGKGYYSMGIYSWETLKCYFSNITAVTNALYLREENKNNYIYGGTFSGYLWGGINIKTSNGKTYIENALIQNGEYNGKYDVGNEETHNALTVAGSSYSFNNEVYVDNSTIIGDNANNAITVGNTSGGATGNILRISNSRITGPIIVGADQKLCLGIGMDSVTDEQITANGTVERTNMSYKGMDKDY